MGISRTAVFALMLPVPAAAYLVTTAGDVSAGSQCLPSAQAVREEVPGAWASWSMHVANHHGVKCWFPVARDNHSHHVEAAVHRTPERRHHNDAADRDDDGNAGAKPAAAPDAYAAQRSDLTWAPVHAAAPAAVPPPPPPSSFEDRFSAARDAVTGQRPSLIQHMMDPVGVVPDSP